MMIDSVHRATKDSRQALSIGGNRGAVSLNDTPVHSRIFVVVRRNLIKFGAADIGADSVDEIVPTVAAFQLGRGCNVRLSSGPFADPRRKLLLRFEEFALLSFGKPD